jgi:peptide/nickel transport system permease protein
VTLRVVVERVAHAVLSMLLLTLFIFVVVRLTGDPTFALLPEDATAEQREAMREQLGLDKPVFEQYLIFVGNIARGDLGTSFLFHIPVSELIAQRFPMTALLAAAALVLILAVGIPLGTYAAYKRGGWVDRIARFVAVLGQSAPSFWVGLLLIFVLAITLDLLPPGGYGGLDHLVLPAVTVAWAAIAGLTRLLRSSMIEVLETDYVKLHRLKGVPEREILWKHGLRNAGLSALTFTGVLTAGLLTGSIVAETVFVWPGMGLLISDSITGRDFAVVQGVVLVFSALYITVNLVVDLLYAVLNPRLR